MNGPLMRLAARAACLAALGCLAASGMSPVLAAAKEKAKPPEASPAATVFPPLPPPVDTSGLDLAFGAFQRGYYLTAFDEATKRVEASQDPVAMTLLGQLYAEGLGVPPSREKAATWYAEAARRGNRDAMFAYGMMKLQGDGTAKDEAGAVLFLSKAAELKVAAASYNLGILALRPKEKGEPDFATALSRFREAAALGSADADYSLGVLSKEGKGMAADPAAAYRHFLAASQAGHVDAMIELGIALFNGDGVAKDETAAAKWFRKAAEAGSAIGRNRLARLYAVGKGVPADPKLAGMWNWLAKSAGLSDPWLDEFMSGQPGDVKEAALAAAKSHGL